jgi:cell division protein FtsA
VLNGLENKRVLETEEVIDEEITTTSEEENENEEEKPKLKRKGFFERFSDSLKEFLDKAE